MTNIINLKYVINYVCCVCFSFTPQTSNTEEIILKNEYRLTMEEIRVFMNIIKEQTKEESVLFLLLMMTHNSQ